MSSVAMLETRGLRKQAFGWYALAVVIVLLDQWTKSLALAHLDYGRPLTILPVFDLTLQFNRGAAFSFLSSADGWQRWFFSGIAIVIGALLMVWIARIEKSQRLLTLAMTLILGGALGNLWDRLVLGYVVDFISVHWEQHYFPAFNLADSAITVGAGLMLLDMFLHPESSRKDAG